MVAVLRVKIFHVEVFFSGSLEHVKPDIVEDIRSLTEQTAVQQVMTIHGVQSAGTVYIVNADNQELCLYDVYLNDGGLAYEHSVSRLPDVACGQDEGYEASEHVYEWEYS